MSNTNDVEHYFIVGGDEIFWDGDSEDLVMINGETGLEDRISLKEKILQNADERADVILANFLYLVQEYVGIQFGINRAQIVGTITLNEEQEVESNPKKREDMN